MGQGSHMVLDGMHQPRGGGGALKARSIATDEIIDKIIETQTANLDFLTDELIWFHTTIDETRAFS